MDLGYTDTHTYELVHSQSMSIKSFELNCNKIYTPTILVPDGPTWLNTPNAIAFKEKIYYFSFKYKYLSVFDKASIY